MEAYKIINFNESNQYESNWVKTEVNGRKVEYLREGNKITVEYPDGTIGSVPVEELNVILVRDVTTGNYLGISKDCINSGEVTANVWYTGYADVTDKQQHVKAIDSCEAGMVIVSNDHRSELARSDPEKWDKWIEENDDLLDWASQTYNIDVKTK